MRRGQWTDALRVDSTRARAPQARTAISEECASWRHAARPTVLSTGDLDDVRRRYACDGAVAVDLLRVS